MTALELNCLLQLARVLIFAARILFFHFSLRRYGADTSIGDVRSLRAERRRGRRVRVETFVGPREGGGDACSRGLRRKSRGAVSSTGEGSEREGV